MSEGDIFLCQDIEDALPPFISLYGEAVIAAVRPIVMENCRSGRVRRYMQHRPQCTPTQYVHYVIEQYRAVQPLVYRLRVLQEDAAWITLLQQLTWIACKHLRRKNFSPATLKDVAEEYVYEAIPALWQGYFPYHSSFEAWAARVVQNTIDKGARRLMAQKRGYRQEVELDEPGTQRLLQDVLMGGVEEQVSRRYDLARAFHKLPWRYVEVLYLHYYQGMNFDEIALGLDISLVSVYALHKRAKKALRDLLA